MKEIQGTNVNVNFYKHLSHSDVDLSRRVLYISKAKWILIVDGKAQLIDNEIVELNSHSLLIGDEQQLTIHIPYRWS